MVMTPKTTKLCSVCGNPFPCYPSSIRKITCGKPECKKEQWRRSRVGKTYNRKSIIGKGKDLTGRTLGYLEVIEPVGTRNRRLIWKCKCHGAVEGCKGYTEVTSDQLRACSTISCGCRKIEFGKETAPLARQANIKYDTNIGRIASKTISTNNASGIRGVSLDKASGKWRATIGFQKKIYNLGRYKNIEDAAKARAAAEGHLYDEFLEWYNEQYPERE